ncbi:type II toxin-antitoxin system RelE/ParE family toxin [Hyphomicrobium sp. DY-1]|uniref:type II toxin-antitoxin system RelE/ParE family toxin n=1 Tax=Hyphomicrobium sp. DY-1 TaxID=3075650 RepID=UPI0039C396A3
MIVNFADRATADFYQTGKTKEGWQSVGRIAMRKLDQLAAATTLEQMAVPPGNRLEALKGKRLGQHSIRINNQWRICFRWTEAGPSEVEITDYH